LWAYVPDGTGDYEPIPRAWAALRRQGISARSFSSPLGNLRTCRHCRCTFLGQPNTAYCTEVCVQQAANARQNEQRGTARQKAREGRHCLGCHEPLTAQRSTKRYCSARCRVAAHRRNRPTVAQKGPA
jgi:hypothetical protein